MFNYLEFRGSKKTFMQVRPPEPARDMILAFLPAAGRPIPLRRALRRARGRYLGEADRARARVKVVVRHRGRDRCRGSWRRRHARVSRGPSIEHATEALFQGDTELFCEFKSLVSGQDTSS